MKNILILINLLFFSLFITVNTHANVDKSDTFYLRILESKKNPKRILPFVSISVNGKKIVDNKNLRKTSSRLYKIKKGSLVKVNAKILDNGSLCKEHKTVERSLKPFEIDHHTTVFVITQEREKCGPKMIFIKITGLILEKKKNTNAKKNACC